MNQRLTDVTNPIYTPAWTDLESEIELLADVADFPSGTCCGNEDTMINSRENERLANAGKLDQDIVMWKQLWSFAKENSSRMLIVRQTFARQSPSKWHQFII